MLSSDETLLGLSRISNDWLGVAVAWHVVLALALVAVSRWLWTPSARSAALLSTTPLLSVSWFAWLGHNPFNGWVFLVATLVLAAISLRADPGRSSALRSGPAGWAPR